MTLGRRCGGVATGLETFLMLALAMIERVRLRMIVLRQYRLIGF